MMNNGPKSEVYSQRSDSSMRRSKETTHDLERNTVSIRFMAKNRDIKMRNSDQLSCSLMYTQILKEILLTIRFEDKHFREFIDYCRKQYVDNEMELNNIRQLEREYRDFTPVWWYTRDSFLYTMVNRALRVMDANLIVKMGFYINDLHRQIDQLHREQVGEHSDVDVFTLYRGQSLSRIDFEKLTQSKDGLTAFNSFLSTSKDRIIALECARSNLANPDMVGILFVMRIDPTQSTTPFASTVDVSFYGANENEVLFSMHSVFRIGDIQPMNNEDSRLYQVDLTLTNENDKDLCALTEHIRQEMLESTGWHPLGELLLKMGQFNEAQEVYQILLDQTTDDTERALIYRQLGIIKTNQGEYQKAIQFHQRAVTIHQKILPLHQLGLATLYNNFGDVYRKLKIYPTALYYHQEALKIQKQLLPSNHLDLAGSYNNLGIIYRHMNDSSKAFDHYKKAFDIRKQLLPANHPDLAVYYNNISLLYRLKGDYSKALSYYKKALEIQEQSLHSNHPDLGTSYNNIGRVYFELTDYAEALSNYEKALRIRQQSLSPDHPELGSTHNNIGMANEELGNYSKAYISYKTAVTIAQRSLPTNHPDLQYYKKRLSTISCRYTL